MDEAMRQEEVRTWQEAFACDDPARAIERLASEQIGLRAENKALRVAIVEIRAVAAGCRAGTCFNALLTIIDKATEVLGDEEKPK